MEEGWHITTGQELLMYSVGTTQLTLDVAVKECTIEGARLWDQDAGLAANMPELEEDKNYWITSVDSRLASRTIDTPYDVLRNCQTVRVHDQMAGMHNGMGVNQYSTCEGRQARMVCIQEIPDPVAKQPFYRETKAEIEDIKSKSTMKTDLEKVKMDIAEATLTEDDQELIENIAGRIAAHLSEIMTLDAAPIPDFGKIKTEWTEAQSQIKELRETIKLATQKHRRSKRVKMLTENRMIIT